MYVLEVQGNSKAARIVPVNVFYFEEELSEMSVEIGDPHLVTFSSKNTIKVYLVLSAYRLLQLRTLSLFEFAGFDFQSDRREGRPRYERFDIILCVFL